MIGCRIPRSALEQVDPVRVQAELQRIGYTVTATNAHPGYSEWDREDADFVLVLPVWRHHADWPQRLAECLAAVAQHDDICPREVAKRCRKETT